MLPQTAPYLINTIKNWPSVDLQLRVWFWADYCESGFLLSSEGMPDLVAALGPISQLSYTASWQENNEKISDCMTEK